MSERVKSNVDLHTHSIFSDGSLSVEELVEEALWRGLSAIALTDHDTVDGLGEAARVGQEQKIEIINGVELSCEYELEEVHVLGLLIEPDATMSSRLVDMRAGRKRRMGEMLDRLAGIGIDVSIDELSQEDDGCFGRPHLARALVDRGVVRNVSEAFARYIGDGGPAYVPKKRFGVDEAIEMIHGCGGLSIIAHPGIGCIGASLERFVPMGIDGLEVHYPKHTPERTSELTRFCREHDLVISGGSDFHAKVDGHRLGVPPVSYSVLEELKQRKVKKG